MKLFIVVACCLVSMALAKPTEECRRNRPKIKPSECCTGADLIDDAVMATCQKEFPVAEDMEGPKRFRRGGCLMECYYNKTGIFKNGNIDTTVALNLLSKNSGNDLKPIIKTAIDTCVSEQAEMVKKIEDKLKNRSDNDTQERKCSPKSIHMMHCLEMNIFQQCPTKVVSDKCTELTNYIAKCKPLQKS